MFVTQGHRMESANERLNSEAERNRKVISTPCAADADVWKSTWIFFDSKIVALKTWGMSSG